MKQKTITQSTTRLLRAFVAALSIMMLAPFSAWADDPAASGTGWTMTGGTLTISKNFDAANFRAYDNGARVPLVATLKLDNDVTEIADRAFQDCTALETITWGTGLTTIGANTFQGCAALTTVELPEGLTALGMLAFNGCGKLTTVTLPEGLKTIGNGIFSGCTALKTVNLTDGLKTIGGSMFLNCTALASVTLPASLTTIGGGAFKGCTALATVTFPDNSGLKTINNNAFEGCIALATLALPEGLTTISNEAFKGCTSLEAIEIPASVTKLTNEGAIDITAFRGSSITTLTVADGSQTFSAVENVLFNAEGTTLMYYLPALQAEKYTVPAKVTAINYGAFNQIPALKELTLPAGVTTMDMAINGCEALTTVTFPGTVPPSDIARAFTFGAPDALTTIYVPASAVQTYKEALKPAGLDGLVKAIVVPDLYLPGYNDNVDVASITLRHTIAGGWTFQAGGEETAFSGTIACQKGSIGIPTPFDKPITIASAEGTPTLICHGVDLNTPGATALTINSGNVQLEGNLGILAQTGIQVANGATLSLPEMYLDEGFRNLVVITATSEATTGEGTLNRLVRFDFDGAFTVANPSSLLMKTDQFEIALFNETKSVAHNMGWKMGMEYRVGNVDVPVIARPKATTTYTNIFQGAPATGMVHYEGLKAAEKEDATGDDVTVSTPGTLLEGKGDDDPAGNITLGTGNVFFDNVVTETLTIGSGVEFTLTEEVAKELTVTGSYVNNGGTFTDQTGSVTRVVDGSDTPILSYNPPAPTAEIPANASAVSIQIVIPEGNNPVLTLQKKGTDGTWQNVQSSKAQALELRSTTQSVSISTAGTYRVGITVDKTTLFTKPITVTKADPVPTYTVTLPATTGATLTPAAGVHTVTEGDSFSFTLTLQDGYKEDSAPVVNANGTTITPDASGEYTLANILADISITISGIVADTQDPVYYEVTLPSVEGATTTPAAGIHTVEEWDLFSFYLRLEPDYDQSLPIVTTDRGETIEPRTSDGAYVLRYIRSNIAITIGGIVKNAPSSIDEPDALVKVWAHDGTLRISTPREMETAIFNFNGVPLKTLRISGERQIPLPEGAYIIKVGGKTFKVIL